ncbi:dolichyl-phosphate beta-D-mannosyltransferase [Halorubrum sp. C191]|uniref:glycosyltransferase family 2 protein n=1 Tax=Halorubrum sp. C191 TaxID=1383842 RepID=UPI000C0680C5|nr:glycosyltransferase family 2 protein [Halorubrum sp. C191]PHQ40804.1 dolichyl-phosphate beta-D-mannosyltransferase [Halorubrum sp. C191]
MSQPETTTQSGGSAERKPTVGLVASDEFGVLENLLNAVEHDLPTILADTGDAETVAKVGRQLGIQVIEPPDSVERTDELRDHFATITSSQPAPGVIVPDDSSTPIDFERTVSAFDPTERVCGVVTKKADNELGVLAAIPAYNEEAAIADVVTKTKQYADLVLVIDDGSSDDTVPLAKEAGATVVEHEENGGYGAALRTAFKEASERRADHLVILDGDGQHDPSDIPEAVEVQEDGADIVIGSRFADDSKTELPLYRRFGLSVINFLTNLSMGVVRSESRVGDTQSGFRTYNPEAIESLSGDESIGSGMSASTDILYHAHQHEYEVEEIGTTIDYDVEEASTHNPVSHGVSLVGNILRTVERERPITVLGAPGFISAFVGLGFGYWTFSNYISSGTFPLGLALISATFTLAGVFACFTSIILHSLNSYLDE